MSRDGTTHVIFEPEEFMAHIPVRHPAGDLRSSKSAVLPICLVPAPNTKGPEKGPFAYFELQEHLARFPRWQSRVLRQHLAAAHPFLVSLFRVFAPRRPFRLVAFRLLRGYQLVRAGTDQVVELHFL